jgi:hypothetical protein
MKKSKIIAGFLALLSVSAVLVAADLAYDSIPQSGDSDLVIRNKQAVAMARLEFGNSYLNVTTNGTNNITGPVVLDRVVVGTAGSNSTLIVSEVTSTATNTVATITTAAQAALPLGVRVEGTLRAVAAGDAAANVTLSYR